ncbi:hypothetical protein FGB62_12g131 [Gracilaria domingensis]|nr:hypothetical protein FGB62_12g131 [Gracilaria domingensis]
MSAVPRRLAVADVHSRSSRRRRRMRTGPDKASGRRRSSVTPGWSAVSSGLTDMSDDTRRSAWNIGAAKARRHRDAARGSPQLKQNDAQAMGAAPPRARSARPARAA